MHLKSRQEFWNQMVGSICWVLDCGRGRAPVQFPARPTLGHKLSENPTPQKIANICTN